MNENTAERSVTVGIGERTLLARLLEEGLVAIADWVTVHPGDEITVDGKPSRVVAGGANRIQPRFPDGKEHYETQITYESA
jgi:hypothetical protein